jgi:hypothetical protein
MGKVDEIISSRRSTGSKQSAGSILGMAQRRASLFLRGGGRNSGGNLPAPGPTPGPPPPSPSPAVACSLRDRQDRPAVQLNESYPFPELLEK